MRGNPLRRVAPSPFSRIAARCGKGDDALAAGRPLLGVPALAPRQWQGLGAVKN